MLEDVKEEEEITEEQFMSMSEFREFWEIEYTTGDIYRGELRGDQRHGTGLFKYQRSGETVLGTW